MLDLLQSPRVIAMASLACMVAGALACGTEPTVTVPAEPLAPVMVAGGRPGTALADAEAAHGGTVVMAGTIRSRSSRTGRDRCTPTSAASRRLPTAPS